MDVQALGRAREAFARAAWAESYRLFQAADREAPLEPEDVERLRQRRHWRRLVPHLPISRNRAVLRL